MESQSRRVRRAESTEEDEAAEGRRKRRILK